MNEMNRKHIQGQIRGLVLKIMGLGGAITRTARIFPVSPYIPGIFPAVYRGRIDIRKLYTAIPDKAGSLFP